MAEGDTIHRVARRLHAALAGRVTDEVRAPSQRTAGAGWPERLEGRSVRAVHAYGKHLMLRFEGELTLHSHLRMTGSWQLSHAGARWHRGRSRAWLALRCGATEAVQFDGPVLELLSEAVVRRRLAALGPDILASEFDARRALSRLRTEDPTRSLGEALLGQRAVAGIGNVWKSEACFAAGVDPWRSVAEVSDAQVLTVLEYAREHMRRSACGGIGMRPHAVYRRAGRPCPRCGAPLTGRGQGEHNRVTYWCQACQS